MSISQRLYLILGIMVLLISAELCALWFTIHTLSAIRAYVGGEGLWSKAEKDAVYELEAYGRTRNPEDYQKYLVFLDVSLGDRQGRLEMSKPNPNGDRELAGFLRGRNDSADIPGMVALFRRFNQVSYISRAIADWTKGDVYMVHIQGLASQLHHEVQSGQSSAAIDRTLSEIGNVNQEITVLEDHFSYVLGEGSRWLTGLVLKLLFGAALTVELTGLILTASATRGMSKRLNAMLGATDKISKGDFETSLDERPNDELGRLSAALNQMAGDIKREQTRAEGAVGVAETALREAQRVAHIGSWEWDIQADKLSCSKELLRLCEVAPEQFNACYEGFLDLVHPNDRGSVDRAIQEAVRSRGPISVDYRAALPVGFERWLCAQGKPVSDADGIVVRIVGTTLDVTERKRSEERLTHLAQHDPLTGLPNRSLLLDRLRHAIAESLRQDRSGALLFMDLDHFKTLNDTLGHAAGDRLLVLVSDRLKASIRDVDTVARSGGDEFLIVLNNLTAPDAARTVAGHIMNALARSFSIDGHEMFITSSIGISVFPSDGLDVETLIRNADTAMYQAKKQGRNKFQFFSAQMQSQAERALALHNELRRALERDEFVVHYQPMVDLESGLIVGAEALVRWRHPGGRLRFPDEFIAAAEDNGLIVPIGERVLREACMQSRRWRDAGFDRLRMTVNVSPLQLNQPEFPEIVADAIRAAGLDPHGLELEITESAVLVEAARTTRVLDELRAMGIRLLLDDFGTGYSSMNYLKRFPIDAIKIDQSFIKEVVTDTFDRAIAESIIKLCQNVGLRVTAEGVETRAQLDLLRGLGCDEVQGFLFSAAIEPVKFEELLRCWERTRPRSVSEPLRMSG